MAVAHLTHTFRRVEGIPLAVYHRRIRLARALYELPRTENLATLALDLGFSSHGHFSAAFKSLYGMDDDSHPTLSPDGRTLYFLKNTPSFDFWTIVESNWQGNAWGPLRTVPFSGQYPDGDLVFARDDRQAFFVSSRPVNGKPRADTEIWAIERTATGWSEPRQVPELSGPRDEWFPTLTTDGSVYFGSTRQGPWRLRLVAPKVGQRTIPGTGKSGCAAQLRRR